MQKIKKTSIEDINKKTNSLSRIMSEFESLEELRSSIATRLDIIFSEDCSECLQQAGFIKKIREIFQQSRLQGLIDSLYSFNKALEPNDIFPHLDNIKEN